MAATTHREIRVDRTLCMGSGQCCWYAPNTFDQDDETIAIVTDPEGDPEEAIRTAVDSCPTQAISIVARAVSKVGASTVRSARHRRGRPGGWPASAASSGGMSCPAASARRTAR